MELIGIISGNLPNPSLSPRAVILLVTNILACAGSPAFLEAVEMYRNRTSISALEQVRHTLELGREDLLTEASRISERS